MNTDNNKSTMNEEELKECSNNVDECYTSPDCHPSMTMNEVKQFYKDNAGILDIIECVIRYSK